MKNKKGLLGILTGCFMLSLTACIGSTNIEENASTKAATESSMTSESEIETESETQTIGETEPEEVETEEALFSDRIAEEAEDAFTMGDEAAGILYLQTAANMGSADAASLLGELYQSSYNGYVLKNGVDYEQALIWDTIAKDMGSTRGCNNLGILYYNGWGVEQNLEQALQYFLDTSDEGDMKGARWVGIVYEEQNDYENAAKYYQLAADRGDITGTIDLANLYKEGLGVELDIEKSVALLQSILDNANGNEKAADAALVLGKMYEDGDGVTQDLDKARDVYQQGADLGSTEAQEALDNLS